MNRDEVQKLRDQLGQALLSLQRQRTIIKGEHQKNLKQVNDAIKGVEDKIAETEKYKKTP